MSDLSGAEKRAALLALAGRCERSGFGLTSAALTQVAALDLDDSAVCAKWGAIVGVEISGTRARDARYWSLLNAGELLRGESLTRE